MRVRVRFEWDARFELLRLQRSLLLSFKNRSEIVKMRSQEDLIFIALEAD